MKNYWKLLAGYEHPPNPQYRTSAGAGIPETADCASPRVGMQRASSESPKDRGKAHLDISMDLRREWMGSFYSFSSF